MYRPPAHHSVAVPCSRVFEMLFVHLLEVSRSPAQFEAAIMRARTSAKMELGWDLATDEERGSLGYCQLVLNRHDVTSVRRYLCCARVEVAGPKHCTKFVGESELRPWHVLVESRYLPAVLNELAAIPCERHVQIKRTGSFAVRSNIWRPLCCWRLTTEDFRCWERTNWT